MKTKNILIASTLITSGLLAGCNLADSTDSVKASSNVKHMQSIIHNESNKEDNGIEVIHNESNKEDSSIEVIHNESNKEGNGIEVIHNESNDLTIDIPID